VLQGGKPLSIRSLLCVFAFFLQFTQPVTVRSFRLWIEHLTSITQPSYGQGVCFGRLSMSRSIVRSIVGNENNRMEFLVWMLQ
jgi:hypothetical protein